MAVRKQTTFTTVRTEGGLLPPDLLQRITDGDRELGGMNPQDYHLAEGERLNEAINRSWTRLVGIWAGFQAAASKLSPDDAATGLTRERWLLILFQELGYGRLQLAKGLEVAGKTFAISHQWLNTPIHLIGCGVDLDKRTAGVAGAARSSPHSLLQEFLNRDEKALWGFVSNGLQLRLLRDNARLTRQAFVEFDLDAMMRGEVYSDFVLLWLICHQSRMESETPAECWLERWSQTAQKQGARALDKLRVGVEDAIKALGCGFLSHPSNESLRERLRSGELSTQDFYRQILRGVYRLLFLFAAEDRNLLLLPTATDEAVTRYTRFYSTARLRTLAQNRRGTRHSDLFQSVRLVMQKLGDDSGCPDLALPALGSFLFSDAAVTDVGNCEISNGDFLDAIRSLALTAEPGGDRSVDYKNLGAEELGSVYESLLELHPQIQIEAGTLDLGNVEGHERKTSGSYYTPDSLVQCLLDSALEPVVQEAIKGRSPGEAEGALLSLKVCDPAVGSGHFLVGAAHRLAKHLAGIRALAQGETEPSPLLYQSALRDVIGRCLYGVDINPMSAELCRVSLWLEALEPGKPLSFLDHHIRVGNSLLGATPELIAAGLPDDAFTAIEGDDKTLCSALKRRNRQEREGQLAMFHLMGAESEAQYKGIEAQTRAIDESPDGTIEEIRRKSEQFHRLVVSPDYRHAQLVADAWCSAFVWKRQANSRFEQITTDTIRRLERDSNALSEAQGSEVEPLASQYQFFHWHLAFPEVFSKGGFDCVLGNPPWDKIQPEEEKFFSAIRPDITNAESAKLRKDLIAQLPTSDKKTYDLWISYKRQIEAVSHLLKSSGAYPLSSEGNLNLYRIFSELSTHLLLASGQAGLVVQTAFATGESGKELFDYLLRSRRLTQFLDFENRQEFFQAVDTRFRFCLLTFRGGIPPESDGTALFGWLLHDLRELVVPGRLVRLSSIDLQLFNPTSKTCPIFTSQDDLNVSRVIYTNSQHIALSETERFGEISLLGELFNLTRDSRFFLARNPEAQGGVLPLLEAKYIHQFDHRFATVEGDHVIDSTDTQKKQCNFSVTTGKVVDTSEVVRRMSDRGVRTQWLAGFRRISSATNERTAIMAICPPGAIGNTINLALGLTASEAGFLVANVNAFPFDYCCRQKVSGTDINIWIFKQLPVIPLARYFQVCGWAVDKTIGQWLLSRVLELIYTAWDLEAFARDCGYPGSPFRWDEHRRFLLRCELDAAFFHLYLPCEASGEWHLTEGKTPEGVGRLKASFPSPRDAVAYIMDTFPIVKRKDEAAYGGYRTKDTILTIYDEMLRVITENAAAQTVGRQPTGSYQTSLSPLPGPPRDVAGNFIPVREWSRAAWPSHIHLPKEPVVTEGGVPVADIAAMTYPANELDKLVCSAALSIVEQSGGLSSIDHLDTLLLVTHPEWCKVFVDQDDRRDFDSALQSAPSALFVRAEQSVQWKRCRDYLEQRQAIVVSHGNGEQAISPGVLLASVKAVLPGGIDGAVLYSLKVLEKIRILRQDLSRAPQHQQVVMSVFADAHHSNQLVT